MVINPLQNTAIALASKNIPVFPVYGIKNKKCACSKSPCHSPGKHPIPMNGFKSATTNKHQIDQWWTQTPEANIGVVTGAISGLLIVDIDPRHGGDDSVLTLEKQYGPFPPTKEVLTGGGGRHLYFKYPVGEEIACSTGTKEPFLGIDIKSNGGYVLAPPSSHVLGRKYEWEVSSWEQPIAEAPDWFLKRLKTSKTISSQSFSNGSQDWSSFLNEPFSEGLRNSSLTKIAGYLFGKRLEGSFALQICHLINDSYCHPPLPQQEVLKIVNSIALREAQKLMGVSSDKTT